MAEREPAAQIPVLILAADVGTTGTKAAVVDGTGKVLSFAEGRNPLRRPEPGAAEHDPEALYRTLTAIIRKAARGLGGRISAIVLSGYQLGLVALDRGGRPLTGVMTLLDTRPQETFGSFSRARDLRRLYRRTGCPPFALYPLSRLYWLRVRRPGIFRRSRLFLGAKDYLAFRLTGIAATEASLSSATQMLNIHTRDWDDEALSMGNVDRRRLPEVLRADRPLARISSAAAAATGLSRDVRLIPGVYDAAAMILGMGGMKRGVGSANLGTSAMFRTLASRPVLDDPRRMSLQTYCFDENRWLAGAGINNAGNVLDWLVRSFGLKDEAALERLAKRVPREAGTPLFLPFLTGERDPRIGGLATGALVGLKESHGAGHLALAAMEGVALTVRLVRGTLAERGVKVKEVRAGGGGTKSKLWVRILADALNLPVTVPAGVHPSLLGSAMLGFTALGRWPDLEEAARRMVRTGVRVRPDKRNASRLESDFSRYRSLIPSLFGTGKS